MMLSKSRYELWKTSAKKHYQSRQLPVVNVNCSTFGYSILNHEHPPITISTEATDNGGNIPEFYWFLYFLQYNYKLFPDYSLIIGNAQRSCRKATLHLDPEGLKSTTGLNHWFKVTIRGKAFQEIESCSFWFFEENESLVKDKRLIIALLNLKCVLFYVLTKFWENYLICEKKEELPEIGFTCCMYILQSEQPSLAFGCADTLEGFRDTSSFEWFLFYLNKHSREFPYYHWLVSVVKDKCNKFTSAVLQDLKDRTPLSELDAPEENGSTLESWRGKYPNDCLLQFSMQGDVIQGNHKTNSPRFNVPLQWSELQKKKEFKRVKRFMKCVLLFARRAYIAETEKGRRLREETSSSENADTEGPSTLQITAKDMQETELLAGFKPWREYL